jgi:hypothetical protein
MHNLEDEFHHAMIRVTDFANRHRFGIRFRQMIERYGAIDTAKQLLSTQEIQTGLMRLWEMDALDMSMEAFVVQEQFQPLFSEYEIQEAARRLIELGYLD